MYDLPGTSFYELLMALFVKAPGLRSKIENQNKYQNKIIKRGKNKNESNLCHSSCTCCQFR